jgi:hypothetical protein
MHSIHCQEEAQELRLDSCPSCEKEVTAPGWVHGSSSKVSMLCRLYPGSSKPIGRPICTHTSIRVEQPTRILVVPRMPILAIASTHSASTKAVFREDEKMNDLNDSHDSLLLQEKSLCFSSERWKINSTRVRVSDVGLFNIPGS